MATKLYTTATKLYKFSRRMQNFTKYKPFITGPKSETTFLR